MRKLLYLCVLAAGGLGCTKPNPALSCEDGLCSDPTVPYCDVSGSLGGDGPNTCIHVSCTASEFAECRGDKAVTCNATGDNYDLLTCSQGCDASMGGCKPEPPCETLDCKKHIIPKYAPSECNELATNGDLVVSADLALNTSNDSMCAHIVASQQVGVPELCVVHYHSITIDRNKTVTVTGQRALALVADEELFVDGIIDVSASGNADGPGVTTVSGTTLNNAKAGGGAGYRTPGGSGATPSANGGANNGGQAAANPEGLTYLIGGSRSDLFLGPGGGGGGALTLISCRGEVAIPGTIDAGGGGGDENHIEGLNQIVAARGGGAGGTIVFQGMKVTVTGGVFANGGGGGGGDGTGFGGRGEDGTRTTIPAQGGDDGSGTSRNGGAGGTDNAPGFGKVAGGAGGGAAGYTLVYASTMNNAAITPVAESPKVSSPIVLQTN